MRKRELERFEKLLVKKRDELFKEMGMLKEDNLGTTTKEATGDHSSYSFHMADQGTDAMEREKAFMLASKSGRLLYHINEALRRIQDNTYGKCVTCGKNISVQRLMAVPHARYCIECKEREELEKSKAVRKK
jgi:DnaK suppressor protein